MARLTFAIVLLISAVANAQTTGALKVGKGIQFTDGAGLAVAPAGQFRLRVLSGTLQYSYNGGSFATFTGGSGYSTIQSNAISLTARTALNFDGTSSGIQCIDNPGSSRTDCTLGNQVVTETSNDVLSNKTLDRLNVSGTTSTNSIVSNVTDGASAVSNTIDSNCATAGCSILDLDSSGTRRVAVVKTASGWQVKGPGAIGLEYHASAAALQLGSSTNLIGINWNLADAIDLTTNGVVALRTTPTEERHSVGHWYKRTTVSDAPYSVAQSDHYIQYTTLTATRQVTLQAAATAGAGREVVVVDGAGTANTNNITFTSASTIYGTATISTSRGVRRLWSDGTAWYVAN